MNCGQRVQINFLEQLHFVILFTLVSGVHFGLYAFVSQVGYFIGRLLFAIGYTKYGPNARIIGAILMDICLLAVIVLACMSLHEMF